MKKIDDEHLLYLVNQYRKIIELSMINNKGLDDIKTFDMREIKKMISIIDLYSEEKDDLYKIINYNLINGHDEVSWYFEKSLTAVPTYTLDLIDALSYLLKFNCMSINEKINEISLSNTNELADIIYGKIFFNDAFSIQLKVEIINSLYDGSIPKNELNKMPDNILNLYWCFENGLCDYIIDNGYDFKNCNITFLEFKIENNNESIKKYIGFIRNFNYQHYICLIHNDEIVYFVYDEDDDVLMKLDEATPKEEYIIGNMLVDNELELSNNIWYKDDNSNFIDLPTSSYYVHKFSDNNLDVQKVIKEDSLVISLPIMNHSNVKRLSN